MMFGTAIRRGGGWLVAAAVGCAAATMAAEAEPLLFRTHCIRDDSAYSACAVLDVNGDGRLDVYCGDHWYQGPQWQRHFVRQVEQIRGRYDDYSNLPLDINGDGRPDIVSCNYRSRKLYWVEHPGQRLDRPWPVHLVDETSGPMETGRLHDIDGDGRLDVLPNGTQSAAWWEVQPGNPPRWTRHALPEQLAGHGIGFGDINGDGRGDLVSPRGWAEAPPDRRRGRWRWHEEFRLHRDSSIPILVLDVDADGDADLVYGRGHGIGLYWVEQVRREDGSRRWVRHAIDTSWSQAHSLLAADLDGDGRPEVIAGKRYLGHDGRDLGEYDPLVIAAYRFVDKTRSWRRDWLHVGGRTGMALDPKVADLDGDGDLDLVTSDITGLYWLENLRINPGEPSPAARPEAPVYPDHRDITTWIDAQGKSRRIESAEHWAQRRAHILAGVQQAMGEFPEPLRRVPLEVQVTEETQTPKYLRRKISFASEPGDRVPAWLLIPHGLTAPAPAMLCLHQTTRLGKDEPAGLGGSPNLHYAHELAQRGYVCIVPDYPSFGEYPFDFAAWQPRYASGSMKAVWNNVRAVDVLESLPMVDSDRIGAIGHSLGGHNAIFTAVFDQRIRAVVSSCGFTPFHHYYGGKLQGWTSDRYMPRIREVYGNDPDRVPFDFYELVAAIAPRGFFSNSPLGDSNFDAPGVKRLHQQVRGVYALCEAADRLHVVYPDCGHDFPPAVRQQAYAQLDAWLK